MVVFSYAEDVESAINTNQVDSKVIVAYVIPVECDYAVTSNKLFVVKEIGIWFHSVNVDGFTNTL